MSAHAEAEAPSHHYDLFCAAKAGDLEAVRRYVEVEGRDVNARSFDASPLFYACLCGHQDVVEYLLSQGAICDENTFDGERCAYGALTDAIRLLLKQYQAVERLPDLNRAMLRAWTEPVLPDLEFVVHGVSIPAHKAILSARLPRMMQNLRGRWAGRRVVTLNSPRLDAGVFRELIRFCYTDRMVVPYCHIEPLRLVRCALLRQVHQPRLLKAAEAELRFAVDGGYKPMFGKRKKLAIVPPQGGCWAAPSNPRRPP